jgi:hypothetical protein
LEAQDTFCYGFANINGPPSMAKHDKHDQILHAISKCNLNLLGLAEININYKQVVSLKQWIDRLKKLRRNKHCATNQRTTSQDKRVLLEEFGFLGNQNKVEDVLNGTYECPPDVDIYTKKFIQELRRPTLIDYKASINGVATTTEHIQG